MATKPKRPAPSVQAEEPTEEVSEELLAIHEKRADDAAKDVEIEMYRVVPDKPRIRALLYGEPGCGKTTLAASAMDHDDLAPVVFANIEGGLLSVAHRGDIHAVDISSTDELYALYRKIKNKTGPFDGVETLVIDNLSEFQTLNLDEIVSRAMTDGKAKNRNRDSYDEIWQEDYGVSTVQLLRILGWLKRLDMNLIITAHAKFVYPTSANKDRKTPELQQVEPIAVLPSLTQKLCKGTMGLVDFVWFMEYQADEDKRMMLTRPDGIRQSKTRGPLFAKALGPVVENPSMPDLYDLLVQSSSGKKTTTRRK